MPSPTVGTTGNQLELLAPAIHAPGIIRGVTPTGLIISEGATQDDLLAIAARCLNQRGFLNFALGSLFERLIDLKAHADSNSGHSPETRIQEAERFVREFAEVHLMKPREYRELLGVARYYRGGDFSKLGGLTFEHYREAMWAGVGMKPGGDVSLSRALLQHASENRLGVSAFRRYIRSLYAKEEKEGKQMELLSYASVFAFRRFAKAELAVLPSYTRERARIVLEDLGDDSLTYIDALRTLRG